MAVVLNERAWDCFKNDFQKDDYHKTNIYFSYGGEF